MMNVHVNSFLLCLLVIACCIIGSAEISLPSALKYENVPNWVHGRGPVSKGMKRVLEDDILMDAFQSKHGIKPMVVRHERLLPGGAVSAHRIKGISSGGSDTSAAQRQHRKRHSHQKNREYASRVVPNGAQGNASAILMCHTNTAGIRSVPCPSADDRGRFICIESSRMCNSRKDCPHGEDEDPALCMFFTTVRRLMKRMFDLVFEYCHMMSGRN